ncbi:hypothetical protein [Rhizobium sp.]|jgi:hypothetical protein|uniref:hypothetical protein n=1 Tax=Rhizobium sp. TaxID=391 RepID=UPI000E81630D|nr:hypothetical protein [Rhizobium sp.]
MTTRHAYKLQNTARCPCCGSDRVEMELDLAAGHGTVTFGCKASFTIANREIIMAAPCQAGTRLAADLLNKEVGRPEG